VILSTNKGSQINCRVI